MEKIIISSFHSYKGNFHLQLMTDLKTEVLKFGVDELQIGHLFPSFVAATANEALAMRTEQGNALSDVLIEIDKQRDNTLGGIYKRISSSLLSPIAKEVESAVVLQRIVDKYGKVRSKEYNVMSASVRLLVSDFELPANADHLKNLGMVQWVAALKEQNELFQSTYNERDRDNASRPSGNTRAARKVVDTIYKDMIEVINATVVLNLAKPAAQQFIREWNGKLTRYKNILAQQKGRKAEDDEAVE